MILSTLSLILTGAVMLIIIGALVAPLESLGWWAGWFGEQKAPPVPGQREHVAADMPESPEPSYLLYLSGIGAIDASAIPQEEIDWGRIAIKRLRGIKVVPGVYPYSVTNAGLKADRAFSNMYRWMEQRRLENPYDALQFVINLRNLFQVAVSADRRYGPIYNLGVANEIVTVLQENGYRVGSGKPVTMIGFSGGGQIALGVATYLRPMLGAPIRVISVGGVMSDDIGINATTRLYHLYGEKDPLHGLGEKLYAGRWSIFPNSDWNKALRAGKIVFVNLGPVAHNGSANYFSWTAVTPDGRAYAVATMDAIGEVLIKEGLADEATLRASKEATSAEAKAYSDARIAEAEAARAAREAKKAKAA